MATKLFTVIDTDDGGRLDVVASSLSGMTRSKIARFIEQDLLTVNNNTVKQNYKVKPGDIIQIEIPAGKRTDLKPEDLNVSVLYQDSHLIVINKPSNMSMYPGLGHDKGTLMNAVAYLCPSLASVGAPLRPGVVHRLDKDTSGVMVVALDDDSYYGLVDQFKARSVHRLYTALVYGNLKKDTGEISSVIGRSDSDRKKMSTKVKTGKEALTSWKVLKRYQEATLIEAKLGTGRTHQIRVHFASIGHPVLGDKTYGNKIGIESGRKKIIFPRQMLHAGLLGFTHPATGIWMEFKSPLPKDIQDSITELEYLR